MTTGSFEALVLPALNAPGADHTYVVLDGISACGCHGRSSGGLSLCRGQGSVDLGLCLATPSGNAGISYGVSGVCHQAANRILWPAGMNVLAARGARVSMRAWGLYGRTGLHVHSPATYPWQELSACVSQHGQP